MSPKAYDGSKLDSTYTRTHKRLSILLTMCREEVPPSPSSTITTSSLFLRKIQIITNPRNSQNEGLQQTQDPVRTFLPVNSRET